VVGYARGNRFFGKALREETGPKNVKMSGMSRFSGGSVKNEQLTRMVSFIMVLLLGHILIIVSRNFASCIIFMPSIRDRHSFI